MYKIGWFSTGRGKGSQALLKAAQSSIENGQIDGRISFVFLSREPGESPQTDEFIEQIKGYGIPLKYLSYQKFKERFGSDEEPADDSFPQWRLEYDRQAMKLIAEYEPNICVLAGYMLIVGPEMCTRYQMINLHPAAPDGPAGTWQEVIWQLIDQQTNETGVMMHLVTPELDKGPVVTYCKFPIRGDGFDALWQENSQKTADIIKQTEGINNPLFSLIRQNGMTREYPLIITTVSAFSQGKVKVINSKVYNSQGEEVNGYDLSQEIEERLKND